jgi:hypothetical protein
MIQRIVLLKLIPEYGNVADREQVAGHSIEVLGAVPGVLEIRAGAPADTKTGGDWDVVLTLRFSDMDAVEAYRAHPIHRKYVDVYLRPMLDKIRVWNFSLAEVSP